MIFVILAAAVFLVDAAVKYLADRKLMEGSVHSAAGGHIRIRKLYNRGAAFGICKDRPGAVFGLCAAVTTLLAAVFARELEGDGNRVLKTGCALMLGGGLNNLVDRGLHGCVTDYFSFDVKPERLRRLVFNLSDLFIISGALLVMTGELLPEGRH